jgi:hypothetical protein
VLHGLHVHDDAAHVRAQDQTTCGWQRKPQREGVWVCGCVRVCVMRHGQMPLGLCLNCTM